MSVPSEIRIIKDIPEKYSDFNPWFDEMCKKDNVYILECTPTYNKDHVEVFGSVSVVKLNQWINHLKMMENDENEKIFINGIKRRIHIGRKVLIEFIP